MKPAYQFNRGHSIHDEPDAPSQPVKSNYEDSNESKDEDDDIEFHSLQMKVTGVMVSRIRQGSDSYDEPKLAFWRSFSCKTPNKAGKDDPFQLKIYTTECQ